MAGFGFCDFVSSISHVKTKKIMKRAIYYGSYFNELRIYLYVAYALKCQSNVKG